MHYKRNEDFRNDCVIYLRSKIKEEISHFDRISYAKFHALNWR